MDLKMTRKKVDENKIMQVKVLNDLGLGRAQIAKISELGLATVYRIVKSDFDFEKYQEIQENYRQDNGSEESGEGFEFDLEEVHNKLDRIIAMLEKLQEQKQEQKPKKLNQYQKFIQKLFEDNENMTMEEAAGLWRKFKKERESHKAARRLWQI